MSVPALYQGFSEYHDVIRVDKYTAIPDGYRFLKQDQSVSIGTILYAQEMTLARGRLLYEVHDFWSSTFIGYIVPSEIAAEAAANKDGALLASWTALPLAQQKSLRHTRTLLLDRYPRMSLIAAKLVSQDMVYHFRRAPMTSEIDEFVVKHVLNCWTSYTFRLNQDPALTRYEARSLVKPRIRDVLKSWMKEDMENRELIELWDKFDLLDLVQEWDKSLLRAAEILYSPSALQYFDGAETLGNLVLLKHAML